MKKYTLVNNCAGWLVFVVAAFTYCSTVEPTASFWDCPEFITTGYMMEIGHPPGAPFFMLFANLFSQFTSDPSQVAMMVNIMSALLSAGCILFLFWTITHLLRRLICDKGQVTSTAQLITIIGSGVVGALAYTFSDTFWFSAVEGEVYAFSSFFTAVVFWLILKWEDNADKPGADRWLVLIAYLMGISIGVHLLNLLCIPAIVLIYYYRRNKDAAVKGSVFALLLSFVLIAVILYGVVPGIVKVGGWFELFFVNTLGMSFNTGTIIYLILLVAIVVCALWYSIKERHGNLKVTKALFIASVGMLGIPFLGNGTQCIVVGVIILAALWLCLFRIDMFAKYANLRRVLNTTLLCFMMLMIGYSTYAITVIRSSANPPMDQNSPEDIFSLGDYLSRDQYGSTPLFYGPTYNSQLVWEQDPTDPGRLVPRKKEGKSIYQRKEKTSPGEPDSYEKVGSQSEYVYAQNMLFPRIWDSGHAANYEGWLGTIHYNEVDYDPGNGQMQTIEIPSQYDNLRFFASYQLGFMYWRYFMWNFCGRQNDVQGAGETEYGNWITGIPFIDNARLGDQSKLPDELKENKGHNVYYALPLLLGLLGLFWQAFRGKKGGQQFWVVFFLFFMTGIAIVVYLNQTPAQPRERDYAYAGSFYAFAIWIGMGVCAIIEWLRKIVKFNSSAIAAAVSLVCLLVPIQMASQNWDDHDRSGRYACRDFGQNYLNTMQEEGNPIIFTNGDNDTFPLWYNQDTERVRRDARVCNLSYLQTDWYIDQMCRPAFESPSVPILWDRAEYVTGHNEYVRIVDLKNDLKRLYAEHPVEARQAYGDNPFELKNILKYWVRDPEQNIIPTDSIVLEIDKDAVRRSGMLIADSTGQIPDFMTISLAGRPALYKPSLMMLEMLANCNWERPLYIAVTVGRSNFFGLDANLIQEGLAYRLSPFDAFHNGMSVDTDKMYDNMMHKYKYGNVAAPDVYLDETTRHMCLTHRRMFSILAYELVKQGDLKRATEVLKKSDEVIPQTCVSYGDDLGGPYDLATSWIACGNKKKADELLTIYAQNADQYLNWYVNVSPKPLYLSTQGCSDYIRCMFEAIQGFEKTGNTTMVDKYTALFENYYTAITQRGVNLDL